MLSRIQEMAVVANNSVVKETPSQKLKNKEIRLRRNLNYVCMYEKYYNLSNY